MAAWPLAGGWAVPRARWPGRLPGSGFGRGPRSCKAAPPHRGCLRPAGGKPAPAALLLGIPGFAFRVTRVLSRRLTCWAKVSGSRLGAAGWALPLPPEPETSLAPTAASDVRLGPRGRGPSPEPEWSCQRPCLPPAADTLSITRADLFYYNLIPSSAPARRMGPGSERGGSAGVVNLCSCRRRRLPCPPGGSGPSPIPAESGPFSAAGPAALQSSSCAAWGGGRDWPVNFGGFPVAVFVGVRKPPPPGFLEWGCPCPGSCKQAASLKPQESQGSPGDSGVAVPASNEKPSGLRTAMPSSPPSPPPWGCLGSPPNGSGRFPAPEAPTGPNSRLFTFTETPGRGEERQPHQAQTGPSSASSTPLKDSHFSPGTPRAAPRGPVYPAASDWAPVQLPSRGHGGGGATGGATTQASRGRRGL